MFLYTFLLLFFCLGLAGPLSAAESLTVTLSWTDTADNEEGFRVYRRPETAPAPAPLLVDLPTVDLAQYMDTVPDSTQRYCYQVTAYNAYGESGRSNEACSQTVSELLPRAPTNVQITIQISVTNP